MARFRIQQRAPGNPTLARLDWDDVGAAQGRSADEALRVFFHANGWYTSHPSQGQGLVHGVGWFRAVPAEEAVTHEFIVLRQDPIGPEDRHLTWSDVARVRASDAPAAMRLFLDDAGWGHAWSTAALANVDGVGSFHAVPADRVEEFRVTRAPTDDAWNDGPA